jgi:hypothetical protein
MLQPGTAIWRRKIFLNVENIFISVCFRYSFKIRKRNPQGFNWGNPPNIFRLSHKADTQRRPNMCGKQVGTSEEEAPLIPQVLSWQKSLKYKYCIWKSEFHWKGSSLLGGPSYQAQEAEGSGIEGLAQEDLVTVHLQDQLQAPVYIRVAGAGAGGGGPRWHSLRGVILLVLLDHIQNKLGQIFG